MTAPDHAFLRHLGRLLNSGQTRSVVVTGNVHDLFHEPRRDAYVPLLDFLLSHWDAPGRVLVVYEVNGPVRFVRPEHVASVRNAWVHWRTGKDPDALAVQRMLAGPKSPSVRDAAEAAFDAGLADAGVRPAMALEFLRQLCSCSREVVDGRKLLQEDLLVLIEAADLLLPDAPTSSLGEADRRCLAVMHDWLVDPAFGAAGDAVVLVTESRSLVNQRLARLPQLLEVTVPAPDEAVRSHYIDWFQRSLPAGRGIATWAGTPELARLTAALSLQAVGQLLRGAVHGGGRLDQAAVVAKVEEYVRSQLGEETVAFHKPAHGLDDVIGSDRLKAFLRDEFMPRLRAGGDAAPSGAAVCGPIGGGKTLIFEAMAAELDMVVLELRGIRSQWFGQTDVIFERLRRVLEALSGVLIFVDEADTQFGGVGPQTHDTERRLTGKVQAMMSDSRLRGRVFWLLMTARIDNLSPDIRRPGRVGDLIIPVLDPADDERRPFRAWLATPALEREPTSAELAELDAATPGWSTASFAALRAELKARRRRSEGPLPMAAVLAAVRDHLPGAVATVRRYQTLQALVNCSRRSLLPDPGVDDATRSGWLEEIRRLEATGAVR